MLTTESGKMMIESEMLVLFDEEESSVLVARIRREEEGICFVLELNDLADIPYDKGQITCFIQRLISKPLRVSKMRHKAFPDAFEELVPNSDEHFNNIDRTFGQFRILKRRRNDSSQK